MGANAQTSVPTFTAGDILTAANMNISARTGVPVFASTVTRDAAFGGTGEKTLAEGQMCYIEGTGFQTYNGTSWVTWGTAPSTGALTLINSTTIGSAVTSVAVSDVFSSTYDNYLIVVSGGAHSSDGYLNVQMGATTTGYYSGRNGITFGGASSIGGENNQASFRFVGYGTTSGLNMYMVVNSPNLAKSTVVCSSWVESTVSGAGFYTNGVLDNTTQYTGFTLLRHSSGTLTGGTIKVYGYQN